MKRLKQGYKMVTDKEFEVIKFSALQPHDSATAEHLDFKRTLDKAHGLTGKYRNPIQTTPTVVRALPNP